MLARNLWPPAEGCVRAGRPRALRPTKILPRHIVARRRGVVSARPRTAPGACGAALTRPGARRAGASPCPANGLEKRAVVLTAADAARADRAPASSRR